jgi:hypothetical protein
LRVLIKATRSFTLFSSKCANGGIVDVRTPLSSLVYHKKFLCALMTDPMPIADAIADKLGIPKDYGLEAL